VQIVLFSGSKKKGAKLSPPVQTQTLVQPTSTHITQHGKGYKLVFISLFLSLFLSLKLLFISKLAKCQCVATENTKIAY
jgi:hypothetical protein